MTGRKGGRADGRYALVAAVLALTSAGRLGAQASPVRVSTLRAGETVVVTRYFDERARTIEKDLPSVVTRALGYYEKVFGGR